MSRNNSQHEYDDGMIFLLTGFNSLRDDKNVFESISRQMMQTQYTNPRIQKAFTILEDLIADDGTRYLAQNSMKRGNLKRLAWQLMGRPKFVPSCMEFL